MQSFLFFLLSRDPYRSVMFNVSYKINDFSPKLRCVDTLRYAVNHLDSFWIYESNMYSNRFNI